MPFTNKLLAEADEERGQSPRPEERVRSLRALVPRDADFVAPQGALR